MAFLHDSPSPFAGRSQATKQKPHDKRKRWAVGNSRSRFSSPGGKQTIGTESRQSGRAHRVRCTARASPVGGVWRRANAFSLCGPLHHDAPLLSSATRHSVSPLHVELNMSGAHDIPLRLRDEFSSTRYERRARHSVSIARQFSSTRYERHTRCGYVLHTQRAGHSSCWQLRSVHWPLRTQRASVLEDHISFSPQCRQSIMMVPARQR